MCSLTLLHPALQRPRFFCGVMELIWGGFHTPWYVDRGKNLPPCVSSPTTQLTAVMASSYPPPFEGTGEVKEGFLCPLCLKDLQSFYQLQDHYEEEHSGDDRHVRGQLKSESHRLSLIMFVFKTAERNKNNFFLSSPVKDSVVFLKGS